MTEIKKQMIRIAEILCEPCEIQPIVTGSKIEDGFVNYATGEIVLYFLNDDRPSSLTETEYYKILKVLEKSK